MHLVVLCDTALNNIAAFSFYFDDVEAQLFKFIVLCQAHSVGVSLEVGQLQI